MKNLLLITIIALTVACSKDESSGLKMNSDGIYTITNSSELNEFNSILESDSTARCVLAYANKSTILANDVPNKIKASVVGIDLPICTTVGDSVFWGCISVKTINLSKCTTIGDFALTYCCSLKTIDLPMCKSVGGAAFYGCNSLVDINLPICRSVGGGAFQFCTSLTTIHLPVCERLEGGVFAYCNLLVNLSLLSTESIYTSETIYRETFSSFSTKQATLTLNANGVEKDDIKNGKTWKDEVWKNIILK